MSSDQTSDGENAILKSKDKIDYLFKVINRFDFYINSTNTKASLIVAWNGVVIGAILLKYTEIVSIFQATAWAKLIAVVLLTLTGICSLISTLFVFTIVFPFLRPSSKTSTGRIIQTESMLFFGSVALIGAEAYHRRIIDSDAEEILTDLADQAVTIAQGLQDKMIRIRKSLITLVIGLAGIFGLLLLKAVVT